MASVCELSCWWALMLFFSLKLSFRQLQALKKRPPWNILSSKRKKSIPCLAESLSVKQVIAPCLLSCHSCLLLDAHHKSTVVWTAALCWNLTVPPISDHAAFHNWNFQVYLKKNSRYKVRLKELNISIQSGSLSNPCAREHWVGKKIPFFKMKFILHTLTRICLIKDKQKLKIKNTHRFMLIRWLRKIRQTALT